MENQNSAVQENGSLMKGILGALAGALIGMVLWALVGMAGYVASIVAMLTAFLAGKGYDLLHGRPGKAKIITLVVLILLSVLIGTLVTDGLIIAKSYDEQLAEMNAFEKARVQQSYPTAMAYVKATFLDADSQSEIWGDIAIGLLFGALGAYPVLLGDRNKKQKNMPKHANQAQDSTANGAPEESEEKHLDV